MINNEINEKIIFSNNLNETELLRTLSKNNHNTFGVRVLNDVEICSYILIHNGKSLNGRYITDTEQAFIYLSILGGYLDDSINVKDSINSFRDCIIINTLDEMKNILSDKYKIKKDTIVNAYEKYIKYKKINNLYDKHDMIEYIIINDLEINNVSIEYFKEFDISKSFKDMLNNSFNNVKEISITNYIKVKNNPNIDIVKAYGKTNEIESIFNKINKDNIALDKCQIILTNSNDMIELLPYLYKYNIPYTKGIGVPFIETKPAKLLKILLDLKDNNYGVDGYKALFKSNVFNSKIFKELFMEDGKLNLYKYNDFIKYAGWLRIGFDNIVNINNSLYNENVSKALNILNEDMKKGILHFIDKYVKDDVNNKASIIKMDSLIYFAKIVYKLNVKDDELLKTLFSKFVNKEISNNGSIHITNIDNSFASLRDYNFIIGLDEDYPGNPKENYLIYDEEYKKTGSDLYISKNIVDRKINRVKKIIEISNNTILSYSYYGLFDLKEKNPSSIIYDLLSDNKECKLFNFLSSNLDENKNIIDARINNNEAEINNKKYDINYNSDYLLSKYYSPSQISGFFDNKISFVLSSIFDVQIDDEDDPYTVIQANEYGTLIHSLMEGFNKSKISKEEFINKALKMYNELLEKRPPIIKTSELKLKEEFENTISNLYDMENINSECILYENKIDDIEISGIKFKGKFDRIEKDGNGKYILVDYKTGKNIKHKENDPETCLQGLIYAYMIEHTNNSIIKSKNIKISRIEFRYPYYKKSIPIEYSKENENEMINKIEIFKEAILNHDFTCTEEEMGKYYEKYQKLLSLYKEVLLCK